MRVVLTGGAGFIGRHTQRTLLDAGHEVLVLDSLRPDVHGQHVDRDSLVEERASLVVADVRDADAVRETLKGAEVVCHLAAKVGLGVDVRDLPDYADSNVTGTAVLLAAMAEVGVRRLVLAASMVAYGEGLGSCAVHGRVRPGPRRADDLTAGRFEPPCPYCGRELAPALVDEDAPTDPRNAYAVSKLAQEQLAAAWARETSSSAVALRFHNVYGPGMPSNTPYAGVAAIFLSELRAGRAPRVFEDGGQRRDFVHVRDVAESVRAAAQTPEREVLTLNVGSGTVRTVGDLAGELASATGGPAPVVTGDYRLGDARHITADSSRIRAALPWAPRENYAAGVAELAGVAPSAPRA